MTANALLTLGLTNAALATLLAVAGWCLTRVWKNPHVASIVWLVVLLKLVTPPLVPLPIALNDELVANASPAPRGEIASGTVARNDMENARRAAGVSPPNPSPVSPPPIVFDAIDERLPSASNEVAIESTLLAFDSSEETQAAFTLPPAPPVLQYGVEPSSPSHPIAVSLVLLAVWIAGVMAMACVTLVRIARFRRCLHAVALSAHEVQLEADRVARRLNLARSPKVRFVEASIGPMVWAGSLTPIVVVPRPLWTTLATDERETLLAHEFAHIARRDHIVRRFEAVVLALFWWLPTAWYAVRRREAAAESCCDALVLAAYPDRPHEYAQALFHAVSLFSTGRPLPLASGLGRITELKERLAMIAHDKVPTRPNWLLRSGLAICAAGALLLSARFVQAVPKDEPGQAQRNVTSESISNHPFAFQPGEFIPQDGTAPSAQTVFVGSGTADDPFGPVTAVFSGSVPPSADGSSAAPSAVLPASDQFRDLAIGQSQDPSATATPLKRASGARGGSTSSAMSQSRGMAMPLGGTSRSGGNRRSPQVRPSDEAVAKMLFGLAKVIESPKEPAEVKVQALRSYGRLARGTGHAKEAEEVLFNAAKNANDDRTILGIADAMHALGSPKGIELMWTVFGRKPDVEGKNLETRRTAYGMLDKAEAVSPTVESVRLVAEFVATGGGIYGAMMGDQDMSMGGMPGMAFGLGGQISEGPLRRLSGSAEGVRRLVEATESLPKDDSAEMSSVPGIPGMESMMGGGGGMGGLGSAREVLLSVLKATTPENEEIANSLVEALMSKDSGIRAAAAEALGNVSEREQAEKAATQSTPANRASVGAILSQPSPTGEGYGPAAAGYGPAAAAEPMPAVSESVRTDLIKSLSEAARDEKATSQSRTAALRSLAKVTQGTKHTDSTIAIVRTIAESADDAQERQAAAEVVIALTPPNERLAAMWKALPNASVSRQVDLVRHLAEANATPPDVASIIAIANLSLVASAAAEPDRLPNSDERSTFNGVPESARDLLGRLCSTAEGVERMTEAIRASSNEEHREWKAPSIFPKRDGFSWGYGDYAVRSILCLSLAQSVPQSDEVVVALSKALGSDDDHVRKAAAEALGNVGKRTGDVPTEADFQRR